MSTPGNDEPAVDIDIALALAMDRNRLIGANGTLPWHVPGELAHFKALTLGKPILMGRRTFESIGRPLPGRTNIVVTRDAAWESEGVLRAGSLEEAVRIGRARAREDGVDEIVVIGGAGLCEAAMPLATRFHLTLIDHEFEGDTWLESFERDEWREVGREEPDPETTGGWSIAYLELERKRATE